MSSSLWQGKLLFSFFIIHTFISQINHTLSGRACKVAHTGHKSALNKWSAWHRTSASFPSLCWYKLVRRLPWHRNGSVRPSINSSHWLNWALMEAKRAEAEVEIEMRACMNLIHSLKFQMMCKMLEHIQDGCWLHDEKCLAEVDHSLIYP